MPFPIGVSFVSADTVSRDVGPVAPLGTRLFQLPTAITDKRSLFQAVRETLPLDPPLTEGRENWDALNDSLWSGLHGLDEAKIVIVWPDVGAMRSAAPEDFETALGIMQDIAGGLADPGATVGKMKAVYFLLVE
jgi:hypothetical protein